MTSRPDLWHVGITVSDLERSLEFYEQVVGLQVMHRQDERSSDFDELSANTGTHVLVAWLRADSGVLQLIQYVTGGAEGASTLKHSRVGTPHLSFYVEDVDAVYARLQARGGVTLPDRVTAMGSHGRSFYVYDPDGVPVELWQQLDPTRDRFNRPGSR
jgi:catechol 2,3-dioxygenase-like lactoylglutathione lyase family enzyme